MSLLAEDLKTLRKLHDYRDRAKVMREKSLTALRATEAVVAKEALRINRLKKKKGVRASERLQVAIAGSGSATIGNESISIDFDKWIASNDKVELALLLKVYNHRDIGNSETENNKPRAESSFEKVLKELDFEKELMSPVNDPSEKNPSLPVLVAARVMQAMTQRAETVFHPITLKCYYRIIRELYGVAQPNWTVGAARAGIGGTTSAFVTNECIRAIFAFENALDRTHRFFQQTYIFYKNFFDVDNLLTRLNISGMKHPLSVWAEQTIEAMWLDCQLAVNTRNREMALFTPGKGPLNSLLLPDFENRPASFRKATRNYFESLPGNLERAISELYETVAKVYSDLYWFRAGEENDLHIVEPVNVHGRTDKERLEFRKYPVGGRLAWNKLRWAQEEKESKFNRTATAHRYAMKVIEDAVINAQALKEIFDSKLHSQETGQVLDTLRKEFFRIKRRVHRVLEPSKQYLKWVINRELAASDSNFDAGELVFAATSYGAINDWRVDGKLTRACEKLIEALPDEGRLATKRPFHAHESGRRSVPIGCEMSRALANLLQRTGHDFDANFVGRMLHIFEDNAMDLPESTAASSLVGWNFEGAPNPDRPAVWVTAISTIALDRIVRMLNKRINEIVLRHFEVTDPERPHTKLELNDLIYSDSALAQYYLKSETTGRSTIATTFQRMRAHILRASLPTHYRKASTKSFSAILYGPPGTGKTTLAESLALSSHASLIKLSPSDLILEGHDFIEGRAHDVFEALSMLTRCVVIFDEFEPVLASRKKPGVNVSNVRDPNLPLEHDTRQMSAAIQSISQRDDPKSRFIFAGMLPKFGKLHDAAAAQSLVYCLGTNYLGEIDEAAKRNGRFDLRIPIYKPDLLSRTGTLLLRLTRTHQFGDALSKNTEAVSERFLNVISRTIGEPADQINKFFAVKYNESGELVGVLSYILNAASELPSELFEKKPDEILEVLKAGAKAAGLDELENEKEQRQWLADYEGQYLANSLKPKLTAFHRAFAHRSLKPNS